MTTKERPILFSAPMVRAILAGTKTQTRRLLKRQFADNALPVQMPATDPIGGWVVDGDSGLWWCEAACNPDDVHCCPYGKPGDRLWLRESWKAHTTFDHLPPRDIPQSKVWYLADDGYKAGSRTRASIHMPRWASRITLEITDVRVERLQEISDEDALAEGIDRFDVLTDGNPSPGWHRSTYQKLWERINGHESWAANPWVWVVEFKVVE